jgi:hypothetical protein
MLHLETLSLLAVVLDEPEYYEYARSTLETIATNWFTNDGAYYEGAIPGYGQLGILALRKAFDWLQRFDPELSSPRVVKGLLFGPSMTCLDRVLPNTDDAGGNALARLERGIAFDAETYQRAYLAWEDLRLLQPVGMMGELSSERSFHTRDELLTGYTVGETRRVQEGLEAASGLPRSSSHERSGYAVLRGGDRGCPFDLFVTFDGFGGSHTHFDTFNPILYGYGYALVPDIGYPDNLKHPARDDWVNHTLSHWTVMIDRERIDPDFERGRLRLFVDRPGFRAFAAESPSSYKGLSSEYGRTLCLVDLPGGGSVVVDFFRVAGGAEHAYSFHGAAADGAKSVGLTGGRLGTVSTFETLQGAWHGRHVPYGCPEEGSSDRCLAYLTEVREAKVDDDADVVRFTLPRRDEAGTALDLWMPTACADGFWVAEGPTSPTVPQKNTPLPFVIARSGELGSGAHRSTQFLAVVEPHQGEARIRDASFDSVDGRVTLHLASGGHLTLRVAGDEVTLQHIGPDARMARELSARRERVGQVSAVEPGSRSMWVEGDGSVGEGDLLIIENDLGRNTFYRAEAVGPRGEVTVGDEWTDLRIATGSLTGEARGNRLGYDASAIIQQPIRAQCRGARLVNQEGSEWRVVQVDADTILVDTDPESCGRISVDANGDGRMSFDIYDFGQGDSVERIQVRDSLCEGDLDNGGRSA